MKPGKMTILTVALALCLAMAGCEREQRTRPVPSDAETVAPSVSGSPAAPASQASSAPGAEVQPTPTTTPTPISPTPAPQRIRPTPAPTPQEATEAIAQPTPITAQRKEVPHDYVDGGGPCGPWRGDSDIPSSTEFGVEYSTQFLEWTPDGRYLISADRSASSGLWHSAISIVDAEGSEVRTVVDANPGHIFPYGFYADLSPDGTRIVYSSCEYPRCKGTDCEKWVEIDPDDREAFNYEIATIGIDGTSPKRLTRSSHYDHYPVWSPDGTRIAFLVSPNLDVPDRVQLFTMSADGSDVSKALTPSSTRIGLYPPSWSPDGRWLAFIAKEGEYKPLRNILYTVRSDSGSEPKRIGYTVRTDGPEPNRLYETTTLPSWSPNGERLAFADEYGIHTVRPDGTGLVQVWAKSREYPQISQVSWSPDGSELLFIAVDESDGLGAVDEEEGAFVMRADGDGLRRLPLSRYEAWPWPPGWAVWSSDGSRVAVYSIGKAALFAGRVWPPSLLIVMARDGTDMRFLARVDAGGRDDQGVLRFGDGRFHPWAPFLSEEPVDLTACSRGFLVPEPNSNRGLVHDCEALLIIRDAFAGSAPLGGVGELEWNENSPIGMWEGITVGGSPPRVHELVLALRGLTGKLPAEFGLLTELRKLDISSDTWADVSIRNVLTGPIPSEIGSLTQVRVLDLSGNYLSGSIPSELGSLVNLERLNLSYNNPSLCAPAELPDIWRESVRLCEPEEVKSP